MKVCSSSSASEGGSENGRRGRVAAAGHIMLALIKCYVLTKQCMDSF